MSPLERKIIVFAVLSLALVGGSYALKFLGSPLSSVTSDWGALGDYFGGILGPILSFLLVWLVVSGAIESRRNFLESKQLQLQSQEQINKQIELITPRPEMVYYLLAVGTNVFAVIENIGNATAYNLRIDHRFDGKIDEFHLNAFRRMGNPNYFPPKYKMSVLAGKRLLDHTVSGLPPHSVSIRYSGASDVAPGNEKIYVIDSNMLASLHSEPDYNDVLKDIARELQGRQRI